MDKTTKGFIKFTEDGLITKPFEGQSGFIEVWEKTESLSDLLFINYPFSFIPSHLSRSYVLMQ